MDFKGVSQERAEVYIIDYSAHEEDISQGYPLSGPRGDFVHSLLGSMELLDKVRIGCWEGQGPDNITKDILETSPKIIIGFGSELMKMFVQTNRKVTEMSGKITEIVIGGQSFSYLIVTSPSYIIKRLFDSESVLKFSRDLYKASQFITGDFKDPLEGKEILNAHSFSEFVDIYSNKICCSEDVAYDIETNARKIFSEDSQIVGFSVSNKKVGVYVSLSALDFEMDEDEKTRIFDFLVDDILKKKKLVIHNTQYERPYTLTCLDYEIDFDSADDTLVMARLLKGPKDEAGLKYQAQTNLQYPDWETDLSQYISGFRGVVSRMVFGPKKYKTLWEKIKEESGNIFDYSSYEEFTDLEDKDKEEVSEMIEKMRSVLVDDYSPDEIENLGCLIFDKLVVVENQGGILDSTIPYNWIPDKVLSKYGAIDSIATYDLKDYFFDLMDKMSTDTVDLHKGYRLWLEHMYVAYIMERNGMYWNDEVASKDREFLDHQATECLKSMLKSSVFAPLVRRVGDWKYKPIILSDYLPEIAQSQGYEVEYSHETGKHIVKFNGKRVAKGRIEDIVIRPHEEGRYFQILKMLFDEDVNNAKHFDELTCLYNPSSTTQSDIPRTILDTPELQMGGRVFQLHTLATSPEFEEVIDKIPYIDQKFLKVSSLLCEPKKLKEVFGVDWATKRRELFESFCTMYRSLGPRVTTPEIKTIINNPRPVNIESFDDGGIISVYDNLVVTGIDQDDRSTWTPTFEWMINFRLFKKSQKLISSYIDGSVGRGSVYVVDRKDFERNDRLFKRKRSYSPVSPGEDYILCAKWSPNTVETGRWRSAQHTIPWGSQVKKYYTSRFVGGTTLCPDYSQMEVRTLAAISRDENMLTLFREDRDFHTETAKKIYRKDEVTTAERRFSKTACWFGDTKIKLLDGRSMTIEEMYRSGKKDWDVYSFDLNDEHFRPGKTYDVQLSKYVDHYAEVYLDNGAVLRCTVDHPFLTRSGQYVKAEDLHEGLKLETLFTRYAPRGTMPGYEQYFDTRYRFTCGTRNPKIYQTRCGKWIRTHRTVYGERRRGLQIDHINGKKYDNRPENLQELDFVTNRSKTLVRTELNDKFNSLPGIIKRMEMMKSKGETLDCYDHYHTGLGDRFYKTLDEYLPVEDIWERLDWYKENYVEVRRTEGCINTARSKSTEEPQRSVVKVVIKSCSRTPVYDLSVSRYHNYAVDLGDESAIYVHNTFSLLYGAMEDSFAHNYCNGDMEYAKMVYGGFYEAYPAVQRWIQDRHAEVQRDHRVSLELSGRFIQINPENDSRGALNSMLRKSQNYPIQGQSADLTGGVIFDIQKYIEENHMKSLLIQYVHDSIEVDVYPYELIQLVDKLKFILNDSPMRRMGLPSKADVALGKSLGHEIEMESIDYNEDFTEGVIELKGYKDEIDETVDNWRKAYKTVEILEENYKEEFVSMGDLFILRKAYTPTLGTMRYKGKCKVMIKYYR